MRGSPRSLPQAGHPAAGRWTQCASAGSAAGTAGLPERLNTAAGDSAARLRRDQPRGRPVAPGADRRGLGEPRGRRGLADLAGLNVPVPARLGREQHRCSRRRRAG